MNDDSSSDDEDLSKIRESVASDFISDSLYTNGNAESSKTKAMQPLKSLRSINTDDDAQFGVVKVTPEFQKYVAKHLEKLLEEKLAKQLISPSENECPVRKKMKRNRVRLFSDSTSYLDTAEVDDSKKCIKISKNTRCTASSSEEDIEKLKSVSVSAENIEAETVHWAKRRQKKNFEYKKEPNGMIRFVEMS